MENSNEIISRYKQLPDVKLCALAAAPNELRVDVIPFLQQELITRGYQDEAQSLDEFLINLGKSPQSNSQEKMSIEDLRNLITERIDAGESLDILKMELKERGVDLLELLDSEVKTKTETMDYLTSLKEEGFEEEEINERMKEVFPMSESDVEVLKEETYATGKRNVNIGIAMVVFSCILFVFALLIGRLIGGIIFFFGTGIYFINKGKQQMK